MLNCPTINHPPLIWRPNNRDFQHDHFVFAYFLQRIEIPHLHLPCRLEEGAREERGRDIEQKYSLCLLKWKYYQRIWLKVWIEGKLWFDNNPWLWMQNYPIMRCRAHLHHSQLFLDLHLYLCPLPFLCSICIIFDLLSPSGDLGIGLVWHNLSGQLFGPTDEILFKLN